MSWSRGLPRSQLVWIRRSFSLRSQSSHFMSVRLIRNFHLGRIVPELDDAVAEQVKNGHRAKDLPSRRNIGFTELPARLEFAAQAKIAKVSDKKFRFEAKLMSNITSRLKLPDDQHTIKIRRADIKTELEIRDKIKSSLDHVPNQPELSENTQLAQYELQKLIEGTLEDRRRDWHYFEYDDYASSLYMATRLPQNYACLKTVMNEIRVSDPSFKPEAVLDFGSGMGTTTWAVNETWPGETREFMNVDISKDQQFLCEFLLRGGKEFGEPIQGVYHRQYLPSSGKMKYNLVVSAFSMLELPNAESRTQVIENLWHQTDDILVLVEYGNPGGFKIINDARHFILDLTGHDVTRRIRSSYSTMPSIRHSIPGSHILAPCSHEFECPRASMSDKKRMNVCRFMIYYRPLEVWRKVGILRDEFSYVVLRKKPHPNYDDSCPIARWPRVVEPPNRSNQQRTLKLCCPSGHLAETTVTSRKFGKSTYEVAKSCAWGDLFPIKVRDTYSRKSSFIDKKTVSDHDEDDVDEGISALK